MIIERSDDNNERGTQPPTFLLFAMTREELLCAIEFLSQPARLSKQAGTHSMCFVAFLRTLLALALLPFLTVLVLAAARLKATIRLGFGLEEVKCCALCLEIKSFVTTYGAREI